MAYVRDYTNVVGRPTMALVVELTAGDHLETVREAVQKVLDDLAMVREAKVGEQWDARTPAPKGVILKSDESEGGMVYLAARPNGGYWWSHSLESAERDLVDPDTGWGWFPGSEPQAFLGKTLTVVKAPARFALGAVIPNGAVRWADLALDGVRELRDDDGDRIKLKVTSRGFVKVKFTWQTDATWRNLGNQSADLYGPFMVSQRAE